MEGSVHGGPTDPSQEDDGPRQGGDSSDPEDAQWDNMKSGQQPAGRAEDTRRGTTWAWGWAQPGWPPGAQGSYPSMPETHAS